MPINYDKDSLYALPFIH